MAQALYCALGGAIMGLAVVMYAMSQSNIDQTINLQAAENSYITAVHVSEEARLFFAKAMDFVVQLAIEDVSSHGGLTSKAPSTGMKTTADGVRYWKWCTTSGLPASCDNAGCDPKTIPSTDLPGDVKQNMTATAVGYLADYKTAFTENEGSHNVDVSLNNPDFTLGETALTYASGLNTLVLTRPPGVKLDASFRTAGDVESSDTIMLSHNVRMPAALELALAEANGLPARSAGYTYDCTTASKTFRRICPMKTHNACWYTVPSCCGEGGVCTCTSTVYYDCCTPIDWREVDSATVTDYDCLITFTVPDSKMTYTLSPGEITEKDQKFTFAASYRTWSGTCNTGSPPGSGECSGDCYYETSDPGLGACVIGGPIGGVPACVVPTPIGYVP